MFGLATILLLLQGSALAQPAAIPRYEPGPCAMEVPEDLPTTVECGTLTVPEDRSSPGSRSIKVAVARLKATGRDPAPDPVVYLSGGPGGRGISDLSSWAERPLLEGRDLILVDQRGTGHSTPLCPDAAREAARVMARDLTAEQDIAANVDIAHRCRQSLAKRGIDPAHYASAATAADLEELRRLLGHKSWNLLGTSYGTRLALTVMRDYPDGVRSAVLDSPFAPPEDFYRDIGSSFAPALKRLAADCAADTDCHAGIENVEAELQALKTLVSEQPLTIEMADSELFPQGTLVINAQDLQFIVGEQINYGATRLLLPALLRAWREGETESLAILMRIIAHGLGDDNDIGKYYAVQCTEETPFSTVAGSADARQNLEEIAFIGAILPACEGWQPSPPDPREEQPVASAVPTLLLAGGLDFRAPPEYARRAVKHLSRGHLVEIPGAGHNTLGDDCVDAMVAAFFDNPERTLDQSCLAQRAAPAPIGALHLTTGPVELVFGLRQGHPWGLLWLACTLLLLAAAVVVWPLRALWRLRAKGGGDGVSETQDSATARRLKTASHIALLLAAVVAWLFCLRLVATLLQLLGSDHAVAILAGIPGDVTGLFLLPEVVACLTTLSVAAAAVAWRKVSWTRLERVHFAVTALGAVAFVAFVVAYGLW